MFLADVIDYLNNIHDKVGDIECYFTFHSDAGHLPIFRIVAGESYYSDENHDHETLYLFLDGIKDTMGDHDHHDPKPDLKVIK